MDKNFKTIKNRLILLFFSLFVNFGFAKDDTVSILVSAKATTKENAINTALEQAALQAYGVIVYGDKDAKNNSKIKKEVNTLSPKIESRYKDIYSETLPDQSIFVILRIEINITQFKNNQNPTTKLEAETPIRLIQEVNRKNEAQIVADLLEQLAEIPNLFDFKLKLNNYQADDSKNEYLQKVTVYFYSNKNTNLFAKMYHSALEFISMTKEEQRLNKALNRRYYTFYTPNGKEINLRGSYRFADYLNNLITQRTTDFVIADNINNPTKLKLTNDSSDLYYRTKNKVGRIAGKIGRVLGSAALVIATGGAGWDLMTMNTPPKEVLRMFEYKENFSSNNSKEVGKAIYTITIPFDKSGAYTDFYISPKFTTFKF